MTCARSETEGKRGRVSLVNRLNDPLQSPVRSAAGASFPQGKPKLWRSLRSPKTSNGDLRSSPVRDSTGRLRAQETGTIMNGEAYIAVGVWHAKAVSPP